MNSTIGEILSTISGLLGQLLPILVSVGVIYFVWGVVMYFIADDEEAKQKGRDRIVFGVIGLAVVVSIWGLVGVLNKTLGLSGNDGLTGVGAPSSVNSLVSQAGNGSGCTIGTGIPGILKYLTCVIGSSVIPFLFAIAIVSFVWGAIKFFILETEEEAKREQGKQFMLWGIIALAVMISVWSLVGIVGKTFGLKTDVLPKVCPPGQAC
jgi:hypothetical protein